MFLLAVNIGFTFLIDAHFVDFVFFTGLLAVAVIFFFSSSGGLSSRQLDLQIQSQTGMKQEAGKRSFQGIASFYTAVAYTVIGAVISVVYYWEYFF